MKFRQVTVKEHWGSESAPPVHANASWYAFTLSFMLWSSWALLED